jgi:glycine betaine/choline ABC-type transport system substrate-binding protein
MPVLLQQGRRSGLEGCRQGLRHGQEARLRRQQDRLARCGACQQPWAIALRKDAADANKLKTMSDLRPVDHQGRQGGAGGLGRIRELGGGAPGVPEDLRFQDEARAVIVLSGGDTAATIKAAAEQTNGANAAMVYGTDGGIAPSGLVVMADDKNVQPVYAPAPIIREAVLKENRRSRRSSSRLRVARSRHPAAAERPRSGGRRAGEDRRDGLPEIQGLPEVT